MLQARGKARRRRGAFTLIEVLVVVAIIALLVAILIPSLARAREQARSSVCLSNLHQFGIALLVYAQQYNGVIPAESQPDETGWSVIVARQFQVRVEQMQDVPVDRLEVFHCPTRRGANPFPFLDYVHNTLHPDGPDANGDWDFVIRVGGTDMGRTLKWTKVDSLRDPSGMVQICDAEREDRVLQTRRGSLDPRPMVGGDFPTVWGARVVWYGDRSFGIDVMDVRAGAHLPQGKYLTADGEADPADDDAVGVNVDDHTPSLRRVARKMHLGRFTNALMRDGHAEGVQLARKRTHRENYAVWLKRFGVKDPWGASGAPVVDPMTVSIVGP